MIRGTSLVLVRLLPLLLLGPGCNASKTQEGPASWVGHTYLIEPAHPYTYLSQPSNRDAAKQFAQYVPNFLLKVKSAADDKVELTVAPSKKQTDTPEQDRCNVSVDTSAEVSFPNTEIGPLELPLFVSNSSNDATTVTVQIVVHKFSLSNVLPRGTAIGDTTKFSALVDGRQVHPLINILNDEPPESVCKTMKNSYDTDCVPCPDSKSECLMLTSEEFETSEADVEVKSIAAPDLDSTCPRP